jgi:hypothetical protein
MPHSGNRNNNPLVVLVGRSLSSVEFVRDYLQLRFDGPYLTAVVHPIIAFEGISYSWETSGYANILRRCIGSNVVNAFILEGQEARIEFDEGIVVSISLLEKDYVAAEAIIFDDGSNNWWAW